MTQEVETKPAGRPPEDGSLADVRWELTQIVAGVRAGLGRINERRLVWAEEWLARGAFETTMGVLSGPGGGYRLLRGIAEDWTSRELGVSSSGFGALNEWEAKRQASAWAAVKRALPRRWHRGGGR